jgi:hypothetical protein
VGIGHYTTACILQVFLGFSLFSFLLSLSASWTGFLPRLVVEPRELLFYIVGGVFFFF